jgi:hypothetical protein
MPRYRPQRDPWASDNATIGPRPPMRTRFAPPAGIQGTRLRDLMELSDTQRHWLNAFHEAGHVVMAMAARVCVKQVRILPREQAWDGSADGPAPGSVGFSEIYYWHGTVRDGINILAAGERAQDRWLREAGLWTPVRAWAVERDGISDRARIEEWCRALTGRNGVTYGTRRGLWDLGQAHQRTDEELSRRWPQVVTIAGALASHLFLTGHEAAGLAEVPPTRGARIARALGRGRPGLVSPAVLFSQSRRREGVPAADRHPRHRRCRPGAMAAAHHP